jgi:WD40 repeat protein
MKVKYFLTAIALIAAGAIAHSQPYQWPDIPGLIWYTDISGALSTDMNPEGTIIASGNEYNTIYILDARTGEILNELEGRGKTIRAIDFSDDGTLMLSGTADRVSVWDVATWERISEIAILPSKDFIFYMAKFSPDSKKVAIAAGQFGIVLLDLETEKWGHWQGNPVIDKYGTRAMMDGVSFSADGTLLSGSCDHPRSKFTIIFDTETMEELMRFPNIPYAEFSPKDKDLLMLKGSLDIDDGENDLRYITLYDFDSREIKEVFNPYDMHIHNTRFSNEGNYLVNSYSYISLWNLKEMRETKSLHVIVSRSRLTYHESTGLINLGSSVLDMNIVSVDEETISGISVYPNPVKKGVTTISSNTPFNSVEIVNTRGGIVLVEQFESPLTEVELDLSSLPSGSYTARIISDSGIASHSLVKE